ncbi:MAG: deoxyguanosinetriphosphate triphosphohydrolase [Planctomycetia bacterium]|nr:deoxyguanosinetriphosphate triphosphohydrolase [Planctomycetia bacterium]
MSDSRHEKDLANYAMREADSLGRLHDEPGHPYRGFYQRDRDRILHASAFRRLTAKTQVLVWGTNDHHRTRLTHTLEVAQVSRTIARELRLNEDLTEAIALAHDLGHPPFGHAGEAALDACLKEHGGFEHNWQGLRIVEELEQRYPTFPGLNLTWELRESLAFHSKRPLVPQVAQYRNHHAQPQTEMVRQPTLEAQVVDAADSIVYDIHDIDDAFGVHLITLDEIRQLRCWSDAEEHVEKQFGKLPANRLIPTVLRNLLAQRERAMLEQTRQRIVNARLQSPYDAKQLAEPIVSEGDAITSMVDEFRHFLHEKVYHHPQVLKMASRGKVIVQQLFAAYAADPSQMPSFHAEKAKVSNTYRTVSDYLAGMTDRLAVAEYHKLYQSHEKSDKIVI